MTKKPKKKMKKKKAKGKRTTNSEGLCPCSMAAAAIAPLLHRCRVAVTDSDGSAAPKVFFRFPGNNNKKSHSFFLFLVLL